MGEVEDTPGRPGRPGRPSAPHRSSRFPDASFTARCGEDTEPPVPACDLEHPRPRLTLLQGGESVLIKRAARIHLTSNCNAALPSLLLFPTISGRPSWMGSPTRNERCAARIRSMMTWTLFELLFCRPRSLT